MLFARLYYARAEGRQAKNLCSGTFFQLELAREHLPAPGADRLPSGRTRKKGLGRGGRKNRLGRGGRKNRLGRGGRRTGRGGAGRRGKQAGGQETFVASDAASKTGGGIKNQ